MTDKILIIGYGEIAQRHLKNIKLLLPTSNIAVFSKTIKKKSRNIEVFNDLNKAVNFKPNITLICSPAPSHIKYAKIFSKINSHIFIEKPVSTDLEQLKKFIKSLKKKKITLLSGYNLRFDNSLNFFRNCINSKNLGEILSVRSEVGQYLPSWRKKNYTKTVSAKRELGGGVINELSHDVDILIMLFNKIKLIYGINFNVSNMKINAEDSAHAIFRSKFKNKLFYIFLNIDCYRHDYTRSCVVIGSKATIKWDGILNRVEISKKGSKKNKIYKLDNNKNSSYLNEMKYFIKNIKNKNTLMDSFKENIKLIEILKKMKKNKK
ncbi:Gfo/Idh/MocA family oxidoreductase [Candidatus Pelagibacter sp.]|jgi:predicted dehydrogenase|nr:Gfo/Idh/MocA family oxidoreductase [Candidatus Pelagibacter sp.]